MSSNGDQLLEGFGNIRGDRDGFLSAALPGSFPKGASPFGALGMIGNVLEWVNTPVVVPSLIESHPELKGNSLYPLKEEAGEAGQRWPPFPTAIWPIPTSTIRPSVSAAPNRPIPKPIHKQKTHFKIETGFK